MHDGNLNLYCYYLLLEHLTCCLGSFVPAFRLGRCVCVWQCKLFVWKLTNLNPLREQFPGVFANKGWDHAATRLGGTCAPSYSTVKGSAVCPTSLSEADVQTKSKHLKCFEPALSLLWVPSYFCFSLLFLLENHGP